MQEVYREVGIRAKLVQKILNVYAVSGVEKGMNISQILYNGLQYKYNSNMVQILRELSILSQNSNIY